MKKVLIIAHSFPPLGIVGALRPFKFAKYLPDFDWEPVILSAKIGRHVKEIDKSLLDQLKPCVKIHRVSEIGPRQLYEKYSARKNNNQSKLVKTHNNLSGKNGFISYLKKFWETWFEIPDRHIGWFPFALIKALQIIRNQDIDIIYSTSQPFTSHLVALFIKKITKKPWVSDFRDPWTQYALTEYHNSIRKKIDEKLEYVFLKISDKVIVTSNLTKKGFSKKYPYVEKNKIITITNGYDPSDIKNIFPVHNNEKFTITFTGSFFSVTSDNKFLEGLSEFLKSHPHAESKILVRFVGSIFDDASQRLIHFLGLQDVVEVLGYCPYKKCLQYQIESDVLLLTRSNEQGNEVIIPAKLFEYLAVKKPILALVPRNGEAARLIHETKSGIVVSPDDKEKISESILEMYSKFKYNSLGINKESLALDIYDRKYLTGCLSNVFQEIT